MILSRLTSLATLSSLFNGVPGTYHHGNDSVPCNSPLFCYGPILHDVQMALPRVFDDSKTFVDMPTRFPLHKIQHAYSQLPRPIYNNTLLQRFLRDNFAPAGSELVELADWSFTTNATFIDSIHNPIIEEFVHKITGKWANLTRIFNESVICDKCESSFIPIKRPFIIAGGRFREPYCWDSYWILQGLLRTGGNFTQISRNQIENFLDNVEQYGFVPNGGRKYYLNRSQPPMLPQMMRIYIEYTGDRSILDRGLPLLIKEHEFFVRNRSVALRVANSTYALNRYNVDNNRPRPESYHEDWQQANNVTFQNHDQGQIVARNFSEREKDMQYRNLASGAESGWDFSSRFLSNPRAAANGASFPLRSLNVVNIVPVDLNSLLYWNEVTIASFLRILNQHNAAATWSDIAQKRSEAMHAVMWNQTHGSYFDFNLSSGCQEVFSARDADVLPIEAVPAPSDDTQVAFSVAQLMPFLTGAARTEIKNSTKTVRQAFDRIDRYLSTRKGGIASTNYQTMQQWDQPNVWPPAMQMMIEALLKTPAAHGQDDPDWEWTQDLALRLAQRYLDTTYCTWRATGGESPSSPKVPHLNQTADWGGLMFEKYTDDSLARAGGGGEYEVAIRFGWTNGVLIWVADTFRDRLQTPPCTGPDFAFFPEKDGLIATTTRRKTEQQSKRDRMGAMDMSWWDASWVSKATGGLA